MKFELNEDQLMLQDSIRKFAAVRYEFSTLRQRITSASGTDRGMWAQFADLGLLGVFVEEASGGLGWSLIDGAVVFEELGRSLAIEPYMEAALLAVRILSGSGSSLAKELLPCIAAGTALVTVCLAERNSRYNYMQPSCKASAIADGYKLNGQKILVAAGDIADQMIVSANVDDGLGLFLVDAAAADAARHTYRLLDGSWASDITFTDARLRANSLILAGTAAETVMRRSFDEAAVAAAAQSVGCIDRIVEITAEYLENRKQFGQPLNRFQVLQHRLADLYVESQMARSALHSALSAMDGPEKARQAAVSGARVRIDQAGLKIGNQGIHLHGGMGMTMDYPVGHYFRRLMLLSKTFGDTEHHLERFERLMVPAA